MSVSRLRVRGTAVGMKRPVQQNTLLAATSTVNPTNYQEYLYGISTFYHNFLSPIQCPPSLSHVVPRLSDLMISASLGYTLPFTLYHHNLRI
ncbi:hypothetical protein EYC80_004069 [Monilinia laxa]|uniref:Uncharacterized protein n=1 Tax=Monilinia laxa TaxID=61186 RepID=A0A5N6KNM7_MONLA|nr:hypothetical protein EYC80_004069 [Monilinia laxa]